MFLDHLNLEAQVGRKEPRLNEACTMHLAFGVMQGRGARQARPAFVDFPFGFPVWFSRLLGL